VFSVLSVAKGFSSASSDGRPAKVSSLGLFSDSGIRAGGICRSKDCLVEDAVDEVERVYSALFSKFGCLHHSLPHSAKLEVFACVYRFCHAVGGDLFERVDLGRRLHVPYLIASHVFAQIDKGVCRRCDSIFV